MRDDAERSLTELRRQIQILLRDPVDFASTDPDTTVVKVRVLTAAAKYLNILAVQRFGGRLGAVRAEGLVEQVVAAAFQTFDDYDPHPGPFDKAAMLLRGITAGHPFNDGNKRTGLLTAMYYLDLLQTPEPDPFPAADGEALCMRVSSGELRDVETIAMILRRMWNQSG